MLLRTILFLTVLTFSGHPYALEYDSSEVIAFFKKHHIVEPKPSERFYGHDVTITLQGHTYTQVKEIPQDVLRTYPHLKNYQISPKILSPEAQRALVALKFLRFRYNQNPHMGLKTDEDVSKLLDNTEACEKFIQHLGRGAVADTTSSLSMAILEASRPSTEKDASGTFVSTPTLDPIVRDENATIAEERTKEAEKSWNLYRKEFGALDPNNPVLSVEERRAAIRATFKKK